MMVNDIEGMIYSDENAFSDEAKILRDELQALEAFKDSKKWALKFMRWNNLLRKLGKGQESFLDLYNFRSARERMQKKLALH